MAKRKNSQKSLGKNSLSSLTFLIILLALISIFAMLFIRNAKDTALEDFISSLKNETYYIGDNNNFPQTPLNTWIEYKREGILIKYPPTLHARESENSTSFTYAYNDDGLVVSKWIGLGIDKEVKASLMELQNRLSQVETYGSKLYSNFTVETIGIHKVLKYNTLGHGYDGVLYSFINDNKVYTISSTFHDLKDENFSDTFYTMLDNIIFIDYSSSNITEVYELLKKSDLSAYIETPQGQKAIVSSVEVERNLASINIRLVYKENNANTGNGKSLFAYKSGSRWILVKPNSKEDAELRENLPYIIKPLDINN